MLIFPLYFRIQLDFNGIERNYSFLLAAVIFFFDLLTIQKKIPTLVFDN